MNIKKIDHVTINIKNYEETIKFYGGLLGLKQLDSVTMDDHILHYFLLPDGSRLELTEYFFDTTEIPVEATNKGCARHLAFEVDDITTLAKRLEDAGYTFHVPVSYVKKLDFTGGLTKDPNDFEIEFLQYGCQIGG